MANKRLVININERYGKLTVIELAAIGKGGHIRYLCSCECGNKIFTTASRLKKNSVQSCGCLRKEQTKIMGQNRKGKSHLSVGEAGLNKLYNQYQNSAKKRNLPFLLTLDELKTITTNDCYYCDRKPKQVISKSSDFGKYTYNGIDRVDNNLGYSLGNCVPCCKICNRAKDVMSEFEFYKWINDIYYKKYRE